MVEVAAAMAGATARAIERIKSRPPLSFLLGIQIGHDAPCPARCGKPRPVASTAGRGASALRPGSPGKNRDPGASQLDKGVGNKNTPLTGGVGAAGHTRSTSVV